MKAVILAAGKGVRLLPLTQNKPKVMVEILGKPFLQYVWQRVSRLGIKDFAVIAGYKKEAIAHFLLQQGIPAFLIEQMQQKGTGHAVLQAKEFCGQEDFIVICGDSLFSERDYQSLLKKDNYSYIVGKEVPNPEKYGVLVADQQGFLQKIVEKPQKYVGNLVNTGLYKFTADLWPVLEKIPLSPRGEYELTDAITELARQKKVKVLKLQDYWLDLSCLDDIKKVEEFLGKTQQ